MKQLAFLIIPSPTYLKNIAQISSHSFWPNQLIFTVFYTSTLFGVTLSKKWEHCV